MVTFLTYFAISLALIMVGYGWGCYNIAKEVEPYMHILEAYEQPKAYLKWEGKTFPVLKVKDSNDLKLVYFEVVPGIENHLNLSRRDLHKHLISPEEHYDRLLEHRA